MLYEPQSTKICKRLIKPGMVCIDIGAHYGYYSKLFSCLVGGNGLVYAFEPHLENYKELQKVKSRNLKTFPLAVNDKFGKNKLFLGKYGTTTHGLLKTKFTREQHIWVETTSLDDFFPASPRIDFIKIDVEGAELQVIKGAERLLQWQSPIILMEAFYWNIPKHIITMIRFRYLPEKIVKEGRNNFNILFRKWC